MLNVWMASSRESQVKTQPYANGYSPMVKSTPQGDGTVCFTAHGKREWERYTCIHHFIPKLYFSAVAHCHDSFSWLCWASWKPTQHDLKCLHSADKLSYKLYSETFKIWCKHSTLGGTLIMSRRLSLCTLYFPLNNRVKCLPLNTVHAAQSGWLSYLTYLATGCQPVLIKHPNFPFFCDVTGHCSGCSNQQWTRSDFFPALLFGSHPEPGVTPIIGPQCGFLFRTSLNC